MTPLDKPARGEVTIIETPFILTMVSSWSPRASKGLS
jgi:hypothetical protein